MKDSAATFYIDMANVKDEHLHIMRGHLLIEQKLRKLIEIKVKRPEALSDTRLTFNQILCISESLYWEKDSDWLWQSIRTLNNIRNSFSHQLKPSKYEALLNDFIGLFRYDDYKEFSNKSKLVLVMCSIYSKLDSYIRVPQE